MRSRNGSSIHLNQIKESMSRMGDAVLWVHENGLQDDPDALSKYIAYLNKVKEKNGNNKNNIVKEQQSSENNS